MPASLRSLRLISLSLLLASLAVGGRAATVTDLKCDYRVQPLAIDSPHPALSWNLHSDRRGERQSGYQVLVASNKENLNHDQGDLWDSGKVASPRSVAVPYAGRPLASRTLCFWKVRTWDGTGQAGPWSSVSTWEMGLLSANDWKAQWINDGKQNPTTEADFYKEDPAPLFRKEFNADRRIARARLRITGLGYYEARLNGSRIGDHVLDPGWTRYSARTLYNAYDVTPLLRKGTNCLGVTLGNGWYNPLPLRMWGRYNLRDVMPVGRPRLLAQLEITFADGSVQTVASDPTWHVGESPIRFNSIYLGEIYDARKEAAGWDRPGFPDSAWHPATLATEPIGSLAAQSQPPVRITQSFPAVKVTQPSPAVYLYDMGRNFAGWTRITLTAPAGARITLRYGELLNKNGSLNPMTSVAGQVKGSRRLADGATESIGGSGAPPIAWQTDTYIASGQGKETYTPRFTFHGFRYVEVTGLESPLELNQVVGLRLNADVPRAGAFACSNPLFNRIQTLCDNTFLSNLFSVQSDCPHRERFGYGGDIGATSEAFMMNYDMEGFYAKVVHDFADSALPDGMFTDTAPFVGIQYCGVAWAMAHPLLQRRLYRYYGDRQLIESQYVASRNWLDLVTKQYPDHIVKDGLSDHESLDPASAQVMVTPLYAMSAQNVSELAAILGRTEEAERYGALANNIRLSYAKAFIDPVTGKVGPGTQGSQLFALSTDCVPPGTWDASIARLLEGLQGKRQDHLSTGIFGTKYLLEVLSREGHAEEAYKVANQKTVPGWGYMVENGATTLWEHWEGSDNTYSHNHPMFGSVSEWFYQWLGGIQPAEDAVGFDRIVIRPQTVSDLQWVHSSYNSVRGKVVSNWKRGNGKLTFEIEIPANASATVYLPTERPDQIQESGKPITKAGGARFLRSVSHSQLYQVGSGRYTFTLPDNTASKTP